MEGGSESDNRISQATVKTPLDKRVKFEADGVQESNNVFKIANKSKKPATITSPEVDPSRLLDATVS